MSAEIYSVGVDLGGTWIRLEAVDAKKHTIRSHKAAAMPVAKLPAFLKKSFSSWKIRPQHLIVASRGVWSLSERTRLKRALRSLAAHIVVISDVEAAWHAAFSSQGILVIAGTGSIAFGRTISGYSARAGGLGPFVGDEGSAFWIAKTWLQRTQGRPLKRSHATVRRVAALTPRILKQAHQQNPIAKGLVIEAQNHLAELVVSVSRQLHFGKVVPVSWGGSLLSEPAFRGGFLKAVHQAGVLHAKRFRVTPPTHSAVAAVARLFK